MRRLPSVRNGQAAAGGHDQGHLQAHLSSLTASRGVRSPRACRRSCHLRLARPDPYCRCHSQRPRAAAPADRAELLPMSHVALPTGPALGALGDARRSSCQSRAESHQEHRAPVHQLARALPGPSKIKAEFNCGRELRMSSWHWPGGGRNVRRSGVLRGHGAVEADSGTHRL